MSNEVDVDSIEEKRVNAMFVNQYALQKLILKSLEQGKKTGFVKSYTRDNVLQYLDNPERYEKELREISRILYNKSPQYRRTVNYFSNMATLSYTVQPYGLDEKIMNNLERYKKNYIKVLDFVESMNIQHEFNKVMLTCFKEDVYYGYELYNKNDYFLMQLDSEYCTISSIEDGVYNISFNFAYFEKNKEKLDYFPSEFSQKYNKYLNKTEPQWQELDSSKTICIKVNEDITYPIPPLAGTFVSLYDMEDYKNARRTREKIGSYQLLTQKLPMSDTGERVNDFLIDYDTMMEFHNIAEQVLPEEIAMITSPMDINSVTFSSDKDNDNVGMAERDYWSGAGVSQLLFNTDKSSSIGLDKSVKSDEQLVFSVVRQIERWINRRIKFEFKNFKFKVSMMKTTIYNEDAVFEKLLKASQYGIPTKTMVGASLGMSPSTIVNMAILENEILGLTDLFEPLVSSHTQGADESNGATEEGGAPAKKEVGDEGLKTRDQSKNKNRA